MPDPRTTKLDADQVRVLAHPLRSRLLSTLRLEGPATSTTLAHALDTNTGATSYHLRKLADAGLVEETSEGQGRERWWQAAHRGHSWRPSDFEDDPDAKAANEWLEGAYVRQFQERLERWLSSRDDWPVHWRDAADMSDYFLELSSAQLQQMQDELHAIIERYRDAGPSGDDAERVFVFLHSFPEKKSGDHA